MTKINLELVAWIAGAIALGYVLAKRKGGCSCSSSSSASPYVDIQ